MVSPLPRLALSLVVLVGATAAGSCVAIDGGAVEASWVIHGNGRAVTDCSCSNPQIASVRLDIVGHGGAIEGTTPCAGQARCQFACQRQTGATPAPTPWPARPRCQSPCQRQTGATPFDIPETHGDETYGIRLVAVGPDG